MDKNLKIALDSLKLIGRAHHYLTAPEIGNLARKTVEQIDKQRNLEMTAIQDPTKLLDISSKDKVKE